MKKSTWVPVIAVAFAAVIVCGWGIGRVPLEKWDEGIHASVSLEMQQNHTWWSLSYHDQLYTAKPPLKFWLTTPLYVMFGPSELTARLWSAIAGVLTTLLIYAWVRRAASSSWAAVGAAAVFLTGRFIFHHSFRTGETDGLLVMLWVATLYAAWRAWDDVRWWRWVGVGLGLLFLTKPMIGFIPGAIIVFDRVLGRGWSSLPWRRIIEAIVIILVIALPWHLAMLIQHGAAWSDGFIGYNVIDRTTDALYANTVGWNWYLEVFVKRFFPWSAFVPLVFLLAYRQQHGVSADRLAASSAIVTLIAFSLISTKFDWYLLPIYPFIAILFGSMFARWRMLISKSWFRIGLALSVGYAAFLVPVQYVIGGRMWTMTPYRLLPGPWSTIGLRRLLVGVAMALIVLLFLRSIRTRKGIGIALGVYVFFMAWFYTGSALTNLKFSSLESVLGERLIAMSQPPFEVVGIDLVRNPHLYFYLRRAADGPVKTVTTPTGNTLFITRDVPTNQPIIERGEIIATAGSYVVVRPETE